jgi:hypothetical protein
MPPGINRMTPLPIGESPRSVFHWNHSVSASEPGTGSRFPMPGSGHDRILPRFSRNPDRAVKPDRGTVSGRLGTMTILPDTAIACRFRSMQAHRSSSACSCPPGIFEPGEMEIGAKGDSRQPWQSLTARPDLPNSPHGIEPFTVWKSLLTAHAPSKSVRPHCSFSRISIAATIAHDLLVSYQSQCCLWCAAQCCIVPQRD